MNVNIVDIEVTNITVGGGNVYYYNNLPFTGTIVEYNNGVLIGEISVVNGSKEGRIALYDNNGQIIDEHFEKNNQLYGIYKEWDINGNLLSEVDCGPEPL